MSEKRVIVVGSGMAGLSAALRLAHRGLDVTVVERSAVPGGKVHVRTVGGHAIDSGPTVFTMKWVLEELLQSVGADLDRELRLLNLPVIARHHWPDGSSLDLHSDLRQSESAVEQFAGSHEAARFRRFCRTTQALYRRLEGPFIRSQSCNLPRFMWRLGPRGLALLAGVGPTKSMWNSLLEHFKDDRLRQLFGRYATYCGSSPWLAPATLNLVAQVEMDGVWSVEGGMTSLTRMLARLCERQGVRFRFQTSVDEIRVEHGRVAGVTLDDGHVLPADVVVFNGDIAALRRGLLGGKVSGAVSPRAGQRSLSAVTWSLFAKTRGLPLDRHNLFFCSNYSDEFDDIFNRQQLPRDPTVYLCAQDRGAGESPADGERLFCLINAPASGDRRSLAAGSAELRALRLQMFSRLKKFGLDVEFGEESVVETTPYDFHQRFPGTGGALYGQATHGWMSIFSRPGAVSPIPGLYMAGGSVHPGAGVPMATMSGRLVAEAVLANHGSTKASRTVGISGGMSTP